MSEMPPFRNGEQLRELLEDFEIVRTPSFAALVGRVDGFEDFSNNVRAAALAASLRLNSIDYTKRLYSHALDNWHTTDSPEIVAYKEAYFSSKRYVQRMIGKLRSEGEVEPTLGVYGAALVLQRLSSSFFCSHLLYSLGHTYEGHSIARLILEQIAWAYAAHGLEELAGIEQVSASRSIGRLKKLWPEAGPLYGFLSDSAHIEYKTHPEFINREGDKGFVVLAELRLLECGHIVLALADVFGIVWELSQFYFIDQPEAIAMEGGVPQIRSDRPFAAERSLRLEAIKASMETPGEI